MSRNTSPRTPQLIAAVLLAAAVLGTAGACARGLDASGDPRGSASPPGGPVVLDDQRHPELEGLVFVRAGSIWAVEDGIARRVIETERPWSLRTARSGDAVTWISLAGAIAHVRTAVRGDWRPESIWETQLGSLVVEAVHDDVADALWFSVSGEPTTTVGMRDATGSERTVDLPVDISPHVAINYEEGALFATGAAQEPARLYEIGEQVRELHTAATLFSPQLSPEASRLLFTGSERRGGRFHLWVVDLRTGALADLDTGTGVPTNPVWSPEGDRIAFRDTETGTIWVVPATAAGSDQARDTGLRAEEGGLAW